MNTGPIAYFAENPVAANLLMLFLVIGGLLAGSQLVVEQTPAIDLRRVTVTVVAPGASAKEVQKDVVRRIEENVIGVRGTQRVTGRASQGRGVVEIELTTFADADAVLAEVQNAVDSIENFPPPNMEKPEVELVDVTLEVMTLAVSSALLGEDDLRLAAQQVRDALIDLPSVSLVSLFGARDREIAIELSEEELRRHGLSMAAISAAVSRASLNLTLGELHTGSGSVLLHTTAKREVGAEFLDIPLITRLDGTIVTLGDVASVRDGFVDDNIIAMVDGVPTVFVRVNSENGQPIVDIADTVKAWLADYTPPPTVTVSVWNDRVQESLDRIAGINKNAVIGIILVFICLVLVFDLSIAFWIALGIPLSFIGALMFFGPADLTLNMATIFGFFLMVGIVVDDAVVVGESIAAEREGGKPALEAAISGARAVVGPITIGVVTTVLAFVPFLFIMPPSLQGVNVLPYVAAFVLSVSLVEAFFILPAHLSHERRWSLWPLGALQRRLSLKLDRLRDRVVAPAVSWSVRHMVITPVIGLLLVVFALLLIQSETVRIVMLNKYMNPSTFVQADLHLPVGTPFRTTLASAERFVEAAHRINDQVDETPIKSVSIVVGNVISQDALTNKEDTPNESHLASVRLTLNEQPVRTMSGREIERRWRMNAGDVSYLDNIEYHVARVQMNRAIAYSLKHDDPDVLKQATDELHARLLDIPGIYQVSDSLSYGKRHFEIGLTPVGKAAGLTPAGIGAQLRANFQGAEVQRIQRGHEELKVMVRYPRERRQSLSELANERIALPGAGRAGEIPLSKVAQITETREFTTLTHIDGRQAALVEAEADFTAITPIQARRDIRENILPGLLSSYPGLRVEPAGGARDEEEMVNTLAVLVPIVLLAMYALMAGFLRSYWKPFVSVAGIPVAFCGTVLGHWVLGWDFTAMSLFGLVAVAGVIVNDSLVLLDRYNRLRREDPDFPAIAAAAAAARYRFRAVFLTSLTTILGLSPLLYERNEALLFMTPFVISMLGGLIFAGLFTLFLLPALVMFTEGRQE